VESFLPAPSDGTESGTIKAANVSSKTKFKGAITFRFPRTSAGKRQLLVVCDHAAFLRSCSWASRYLRRTHCIVTRYILTGLRSALPQHGPVRPHINSACCSTVSVAFSCLALVDSHISQSRLTGCKPARALSSPSVDGDVASHCSARSRASRSRHRK